MTALLQLQAVAVDRAGVPVLEGIDLALAEGQCLALIGANGAGKSTLLAALIGWLSLRRGAILWRGRDIASWPAHKRVRGGLGYCPEGRRPFAAMTVRDNLLSACRAGRDEARTLLNGQWALFPELARRADTRAWQLSGGEAQMLALARALMGRPSLLMLDEPFLGLSPDASARLMKALVSLAKNGLALLIAEADAAWLAPLKPSILALNRGRVAAVDNSR